jgi:Protein of unknown function (DUF664)
MTSAAGLLLDAFGRVRDVVGRAVSDLTPDQLAHRVDPDANSIAWLVWHLTRIQDDHVAEVAGWSQVWTEDGWARRYALPLPTTDTGYGHDSVNVDQVRVDASLLTGYHEAVHARTTAFVSLLTDEDLIRVVDERWDPPVTLGVRLVSVVSDCLQHAGQASFVRGFVLRARSAN